MLTVTSLVAPVNALTPAPVKLINCVSVAIVVPVYCTSNEFPFPLVPEVPDEPDEPASPIPLVPEVPDEPDEPASPTPLVPEVPDEPDEPEVPFPPPPDPVDKLIHQSLVPKV